jgi:3-oxoacyl-[acyl-carrier-protein] synthase II
VNTRRVVITGLGAVTPLGTGVPALWDGLSTGRSGIAPVTRFDPGVIPCRVAGECRDFDPTALLGAKQARRLRRVEQLGLVAAEEAFSDSGLTPDADATGVSFATGLGGAVAFQETLQVFAEKGARGISPFAVTQAMSNAGAAGIALRYGLHGPSFCPVTACAASNHALGMAYQSIRYGEADAMIAGGAEASLSPVILAMFCQMRALSTGHNDRPSEASRPFDARRDGFVPAEGAGALVLEERDGALARGARIYAELAGFGQTTDAFHIAAPNPDGTYAALAIQSALRVGGIDPRSVGYINAHATGTTIGDVAEVRAIRAAFGAHADNLAVSSTKSMTGHLGGATSAVEAVATVMALTTGVLPPTINLTDPDPGCDLDCIPGVARRSRVEVALSTAFGFGGHNTAVVFRSYEK